MRKGKIDIEKEYYRLWIEYLKLSKDYKDFCLWFEERKKNPNLPVPEKFQKHKNGSAAKEVITYLSFGNIHSPEFSFDKWFEMHKGKLNYSQLHKLPSIKDFSEYIGRYIDETINSFKRRFKREPSIQELKEWLSNHIMKKVNSYFLYLMVDVSDEMVIEEFKRLVKKKREDSQVKGLYFTKIRHRKPIICYEVIDELRTYLNVYVFISDLIERQGYTKKEAIKKAIEYFENESIEELKNRGNYKGNRYSSIMRKYNLYYQKAKTIIKNVEYGFFPIYQKKRKAKVF